MEIAVIHYHKNLDASKLVLNSDVALNRDPIAEIPLAIGMPIKLMFAYIAGLLPVQPR